MPQTSDEMRALMNDWFGDPISEQGPMGFLKAHGYALTHDWRWVPPVPAHMATREEWACIRFLIEEWDFGGVATDVRDYCYT